MMKQARRRTVFEPSQRSVMVRAHVRRIRTTRKAKENNLSKRQKQWTDRQKNESHGRRPLIRILSSQTDSDDGDDPNVPTTSSGSRNREPPPPRAYLSDSDTDDYGPTNIHNTRLCEQEEVHSGPVPFVLDRAKLISGGNVFLFASVGKSAHSRGSGKEGNVGGGEISVDLSDADLIEAAEKFEAGQQLIRRYSSDAAIIEAAEAAELALSPEVTDDDLMLADDLRQCRDDVRVENGAVIGLTPLFAAAKSLGCSPFPIHRNMKPDKRQTTGYSKMSWQQSVLTDNQVASMVLVVKERVDVSDMWPINHSRPILLSYFPVQASLSGIGSGYSNAAVFACLSIAENIENCLLLELPLECRHDRYCTATATGRALFVRPNECFYDLGSNHMFDDYYWDTLVKCCMDGLRRGVVQYDEALYHRVLNFTGGTWSLQYSFAEAVGHMYNPHNFALLVSRSYLDGDETAATKMYDVFVSTITTFVRRKQTRSYNNFFVLLQAHIKTVLLVYGRRQQMIALIDPDVPAKDCIAGGSDNSYGQWRVGPSGMRVSSACIGELPVFCYHACRRLLQGNLPTNSRGIPVSMSTFVVGPNAAATKFTIYGRGVEELNTWVH